MSPKPTSLSSLKDGVEIVVEPQCHASGALPAGAKEVDWILGSIALRCSGPLGLKAQGLYGFQF